VTTLAPEQVELRELAERAGRELDGRSALEILEWADQQFGSAWCVASSMSDGVLAHLAAQVRPGVDVLFGDTGYHFAETIGTREAMTATIPVTVVSVRPRQSVEQQDASFGPRLYERNPDMCCALRKVNPLREQLRGYLAWATGLRREETAARTDARVVEWDERRRMVKLNPIAAWTQAEVDAYLSEHSIVVNPLLFDGYASIGCAPCTRRVADGEDARAGRWAGSAKTECGLHG
jgi:phosphoadenosine phosphosulfate reductase